MDERGFAVRDRYLKKRSLKLRLAGISTEELRNEKDAATQLKQATETQLNNIVDGGNTNDLNWQVIGALPSEALILHDDLMQKSPYLSDTVLKTAIQQEDVLPNAMIRDVLVANPQASKNEEIMAKIDERWEPMPDYMIAEISVGKTITGGKEQLEARRDGWKQRESYLYNEIVSAYISDTINPAAINELKSFLVNEHSIEALIALTDINIRQGDYPAAFQSINTIQSSLPVDPMQQDLVSDYSSLIGILSDLKADTISFSKIDSTHAAPLFALYTSRENSATVYARNLLIASGLLKYDEPIIKSDSIKMAVVQNQAIKHDLSSKSDNEIINLFPNPAKSYIIVEYSLPANQSKAILTFRNNSGIIVYEQTLSKVHEQVVIDTKSLSSGSYFVSLQVNGKVLSNKAVSIIK